MKKKIAILADGFMNWGGGIDHFAVLLMSLLSVKDKFEHDLTVLLPEKKFFSNKERWLLRIPILKQWLSKRRIRQHPFLSNFQNAHLRFLRFSQKRLNHQLKKMKINVALFGWGDIQIDCPNIGFYPDLQHKVYPQFFSSEECTNRDKVVSNIISRRDYIFVSSQDALKTFQDFFPHSSKKLIPLPFSPIFVDQEWLNPLSYDVKRKYGIESSYFMISNQFWAHKGYETAFEAFAKLPHFDVQLVCTGSHDDYRSPGYFQRLLKLLDDLKIKNRVHLLGHIPKREQVELIKEALAVIQPSLYEGVPGGGAITLAISLGIPTISSDIPVNLEIKGEYAVHFRANDSADLCAKMEERISMKIKQMDPPILLEHRQRSLEQLGQVLMESASRL